MELEYKIIQSQTPQFSETSKMQEILAEEAKAGWRLLEKQSNFSIRLQRDISCRENDHTLDIDPYRTSVGVPAVLTYSASAMLTIVVVTSILYLALWSQG